MFAWCGTKSATSFASYPDSVRSRLHASAIAPIANRYTSFPAMKIVSRIPTGVGFRNGYFVPPVSTQMRLLPDPSEKRETHHHSTIGPRVAPLLGLQHHRPAPVSEEDAR